MPHRDEDFLLTPTDEEEELLGPTPAATEEKEENLEHGCVVSATDEEEELNATPIGPPTSVDQVEQILPEFFEGPSFGTMRLTPAETDAAIAFGMQINSVLDSAALLANQAHVLMSYIRSLPEELRSRIVGLHRRPLLGTSISCVSTINYVNEMSGMEKPVELEPPGSAEGVGRDTTPQQPLEDAAAATAAGAIAGGRVSALDRSRLDLSPPPEDPINSYGDGHGGSRDKKPMEHSPKRQDPITRGNQEATPRSGGSNKQRGDSRGRTGNMDAEGGDPEKKHSPIPPPPSKPTRSGSRSNDQGGDRGRYTRKDGRRHSRSHSRRRSRSRSNSKGGDRQRGGNWSEGRERSTKERGNSPNRGHEATRPARKFDITNRERMTSRERRRYDQKQDDLKRAAGRGDREGNASSSKLPYGLPRAGFRHGKGETIIDGVLAEGRHYPWKGHPEDCSKRGCVQCDMLKGWAFVRGKM